jgi:hypothetical protein
MKVQSGFVLVSASFFITVFFACNRHATTTAGAYSFDAPVRGDTVAYYPTMNAQLLEDSVEKNEAYFYRINRVKRVEITDKNGREIKEIDRFGHLLVEENYIEGDLFWKNVDVYNRYGHVAHDKHSFYNDGHEADLVFTSKYKYEPDGWTLGERLVSIEMESYDYADRERTVYAYVYHYNGHLVDYETRFQNSKCTEKVFITYTAFGKPEKEITVNYGKEIPDTTTCIYRYDSLRRQTSSSEMCGMVLIADRVTEYNAAGRRSKYTSTTYEPYAQWVFEYFYLANGLLEKRVVTHGSESDTEWYSYAFY